LFTKKHNLTGSRIFNRFGSGRSTIRRIFGIFCGIGTVLLAIKAIAFWLAPDKMPGAEFFPDARINFAENLLVNADQRPAICAHGEDGRVTRLTRAELKQKVWALAGWLEEQGVVPGDRVAAYTPNSVEAVITMLATASLGAVFSSCSPDFGLQGVSDRFGQIEPKILLACDGYLYAGKRISRMDVVTALVEQLPTVRSVLVIPYLTPDPDCSQLPHAVHFDQAIENATPITSFRRMPFNAPLYILYSSGTTGAPKCIVHGIGGTLIQHIKEHRLHTNLRAGRYAVLFYHLWVDDVELAGVRVGITGAHRAV
jgi:acetoacetyl-CoA synthetase